MLFFSKVDELEIADVQKLHLKILSMLLLAVYVGKDALVTTFHRVLGHVNNAYLIEKIGSFQLLVAKRLHPCVRGYGDIIFFAVKAENTEIHAVCESELINARFALRTVRKIGKNENTCAGADANAYIANYNPKKMFATALLLINRLIESPLEHCSAMGIEKRKVGKVMKKFNVKKDLWLKYHLVIESKFVQTLRKVSDFRIGEK